MIRMPDYVLAFDVGGTYIKASIVRCDGAMVDGVHVYPSHADAPKDELIDHFSELIQTQAKRVPDGGIIRGVGMAFPGPFDYEKGICQIKGLQKFDALYGVNLKSELTDRLTALPELKGRWLEAPVIAFENDAALFALGECSYGAGRSFSRVIVLTIGTGFGSAFVSNGHLVKCGEGVPPEGWLYRVPYLDGIMDDHFSRRGLLRLALETGVADVSAGADDVKRLAERALAGEKRPVEVFQKWRNRLEDALSPVIASFKPDAIILGGQIAKSGTLFVVDQMKGVPVRISDDLSFSTFKGVCQLFANSTKN
ncbi:ROK family protein [Bacillaceae bacterium SIJ1]|uniref:ROK family protein n=1 Tax=Litoribacterium kuwaitense TaxID=1398745 RepID=UPI0013ECDE04|nr:ROK family protein [Litoribacterium kuwaitense]NGP45950.1 ROK family protein [Litoribacterium kuwaitense]